MLQFNTVYEENFDRIYNYVYYRIMKREIVEDLVSEIFIKAYEKYFTFNPNRAKVQTWLMAIARNTVTDYFRKNNNIVSIGDHNVSDNKDISNDEHDAEFSAIKRESNRKLYAILKTLKDEERQMLFLKYFDGKRNKDIALMLGLTETCVSTKFLRIMQKLRKENEGEEMFL